jgi:hypothetical protein
LVFVILCWGAPCVTSHPDLQAQEAKPTEYQVKAAFIYNFLQFIDWPMKPNRNPGPFINLCILGENPFGNTFEAYQGETIRKRKFSIRQSQSLSDLKECQVVFIGNSEKGRVPQIIKQANDLGILTIGDSEKMTHQGVMINFYMERDKVRFEINIEAARRAGFTISSHLLKLARIIREPS